VTAHLRPLRDDEFDGWLASSKAGYAASIEHDGGVPRERAQAKAETDFAQLVPDGRVPEGHAVFVVDDEGEAVGRLWVAERDADGERVLFVYEVAVEEAARGRGLGRLAMQFAEEEARRRGLARVALNVFGGNDVARGLYRSLGYREVAVWMAKEL
jgi:ribosomal protein S18 acetylase RimI-like enzyme